MSSYVNKIAITFYIICIIYFMYILIVLQSSVLDNYSWFLKIRCLNIWIYYNYLIVWKVKLIFLVCIKENCAFYMKENKMQINDQAERLGYWPRLWLVFSPFLFPPRERGKKKRRMNSKKRKQKVFLSARSKSRYGKNMNIII